MLFQIFQNQLIHYDSERRCLYARTSVRKMKLATGGKFCVRSIVVRPNDKTIVRPSTKGIFILGFSN